MNHSAHINKLLNAYQMSHFGPMIERDAIHNVIDYAIRNGYLHVVEESNPYTFGGVTTSLTDTELASVMSDLRTGRKISAIRTIRFKTDNLSLAQAKDFVDHLDNIMSKMS